MLFPGARCLIEEWSEEDERALLEFILLTSFKEWPVSGPAMMNAPGLLNLCMTVVLRKEQVCYIIQ